MYFNLQVLPSEAHLCFGRTSRYIYIVVSEDDPYGDPDIIKGATYEYQQIGIYGDIVMSISGGYFNLKELLDVSLERL